MGGNVLRLDMNFQIYHSQLSAFSFERRGLPLRLQSIFFRAPKRSEFRDLSWQDCLNVG